MNKKDLWAKFLMTGDINDYLEYKKNTLEEQNVNNKLE